uniref:Lipid scramblase CLPTM1L n=1 Tax=Hippocampus comes TaxID=109280 RepID=A0A3Q2YWD9_HIPCM
WSNRICEISEIRGDSDRNQLFSKLKHPVSHWRPHLSITIMSEDFTFTKGGLPSDMHRYVRISQEGRRILYLPLMLIDELSFRIRDLMEINRSTTHLPLTVSYEGISLRKFRFWVHLQDVVYSLRQFGFSEEYIDEIKGTLVGSNLYLLVLTAVITALQLICEFLALKNDISSWRKKKSMAGMSRKSGKRLSYASTTLTFRKQESQAANGVSLQASTYLSYLVYPLCISGAIFSLQILFWYSTLYAFGFLSMAPQLFINHKVSPAVQPLTVLNTLISDLCSCAAMFSSSEAFLSSHQLPFFRDELFFLVYLYQKR